MGSQSTLNRLFFYHVNSALNWINLVNIRGLDYSIPRPMVLGYNGTRGNNSHLQWYIPMSAISHPGPEVQVRSW